MKQRRIDLIGRLDGVTRTPQGGIRASANLTRVGVFTYHNADGSESLELRHPDDIFKADSLRTLHLAPLTVGHPAGMVTPENYRDLSVGVVAEDVRADGKFVRATVHIQDKDAVARVEKGIKNPNDPDALVELSCGYEVEVQSAEGTFDGETFNARQTGHIYNHVALGPINWGRAGNEVRLSLDSAGHVNSDSYAADISMRTDDNTDLKSRCDALQSELSSVKGERDAARADATRERTRADKATSDLEGEKTRSAKLVDPSKVDDLVAARVSLESRARAVIGDKFDAKGKSDMVIMREVISATDPTFKADSKDAEDAGYLRGRFDSACASANRADAATADLNRNTRPEGDPKGTPGNQSKSKIDEAQKRADEDAKKSYAAGPPACALFSK